MNMRRTEDSSAPGEVRNHELRTPARNSCSQVVASLSAYIDGEVGPRSTA